MTRRILILIGLALTLLLPQLPLSDWGVHLGLFGPILGRETFWWALVIAVLLYVLVVERRGLDSIGLRTPTWQTFVFAIAAAILLVGGILAIYGIVFPALHLKANVAAGAKIMALPYWYRVMLVARAAVAEEILFRGYPIERIAEWPLNRWLGGAIALAAFTIAHLGYWGWAQLIIAGWGGLVLTLLYLWRRDLVCNMLAHFLADGSGFLLR